MCFFSVSSAQVSLPFDFESATVTSVFTDFDGGTAEVVANPAPDAVNESASVAKIVRDGGLPWAGSLIQLDDYLDFSEATSIRMKVWSPRQGVRIKFKLEGDADSGRRPVERDPRRMGNHALELRGSALDAVQ